jgi:hypothetical protein
VAFLACLVWLISADIAAALQPRNPKPEALRPKTQTLSPKL